ncbi:MAG: ABC transporter permease [Robiginitomaculum sp.]|nr:ABC transporter permease [Robiginitomaculum sp.]
MSETLPTIPISLLVLTLIPVLMVLVIQYKWAGGAGESAYAVSRMLGQLLIVGYFLGALFQTPQVWIILLVLTIMVCVASWIGQNPPKKSL